MRLDSIFVVCDATRRYGRKGAGDAPGGWRLTQELPKSSKGGSQYLHTVRRGYALLSSTRCVLRARVFTSGTAAPKQNKQRPPTLGTSHRSATQSSPQLTCFTLTSSQQRDTLARRQSSWRPVRRLILAVRSRRLSRRIRTATSARMWTSWSVDCFLTRRDAPLTCWQIYLDYVLFMQT